ncbi:YSIRK-type signal peptide-containing protein, partial [Finegoldia magna]
MSLKEKYYKKVTIFNTKFYFCYKNQPPNRENILRKENVMNNKKIFEKIITEKRAKSSNERPKYGLRKLTVGVVSCLLGYMMFFTPNVVAAEKVDQPQAVEATVESTEVANTENVEEESEQPKEETAEIAETEKPVSHVEAYSSNAKETNAQERTVRTTAEETSEATTEETAEKTTEFKLTEEQKKQLFDAGFDEEQIQKIENDIKLELEKDANYDVEKHIKDAIEKLNQPELTLAPKAPTTGVRDAAPPEDTDTTSDAKNAVHGYVGVQVGDDVNKNLAKADKGQFIPMEGVRVYFQWFEKKGNRVSPVYAATSDASGQFHMKIKPYIGDDGKLVKFDADTTSSAGTESYKFWVDKSTIPAGYQLQYSTGESVEFNAVGSPGVPGVAGASSYIIPNKLTDFKVLLMEIPKEDLMHKEATPTGPQIYPDPVLNVGQGAVRGKVSWDYESAGGIQWGIVATHTSPAPDVKVRASYLSDYALKQIFSAETANMLSLSKPSDIRGSGWTFALEKQLQDWIKEQVAKEPDKWIAETVSAVTNAEGDYKIQFNGTWGPERNGVNVAEYTAPKGWTQEQKDRLGTVAKNATDGSFLTGALDKNEKHVNSDWLFISAEGTDKLRVMTPWNNNWYTGSNNAWGIHGGWAQAAFGVSTVQAANSTRADFALAPAEIKFNITNYDTGLNTATPGDEAKTETKGLPYKNTSDSFRIVWYDAKGNVVKTETATKPNSTGDFPEATYDTTGVTETTTFTAKLYRVDAKGNNGQLLAQDSFTVKISKLVVSAHDEVNIPNPGASDDSMKGATYSAEGLPKGLTIDPNNGTISGKATKPGKYTVTIKTSVPDKDSGEDAVGTSQYVALVTDSPLKDGNVNSAYSETIKPLESEGYVFKNVTAKFIDGKAIDGLTIAEDQISGTPTVKVEATQEDPNVEVTYDIYKLNEKGEEVLIKKGHVDRVPLSIKDGEATNYEPKYEAVDEKVGTEATVKAPTFTDKDGNPATPENVTYELGEGAPTGAKVNADGSVTYTPVDGDAEKAVKIPVVVKYSDGSTDNVNAVINVSKKSTTADKVKELGGVKPQTIKVWKGDDIDWRHGVIPADGSNSDAVRKLLEAATITDNGGRNSNEAGKSEGTLKVTFTDGSFIEVPKQMLTVSDHIVTIDPNDPNSPSKDDLPRDSIEVRFVASTGVKEVKTTGTTYVKPGITFKDTDFPQVTFEDGYKAPVTWTPENRIIDIDKPGYNKRGYFRFTAKATLEDIIDRTNNPDAPTPDGYVRVTFKNGDGVNDIANNKVYDVKIGTKLTADKYPTVTAKDGYENPTWSTAPGTEITAGNATITATATQKAPEQTAADKLTPSYKDKDGKAGVEVTTDAPTFTDKDGQATTAPEGTKYALGKDAPKGATIDEKTGKVTYKPKESEAGKPVEIPVVVTYPDKSTDNATAKINVAKLDDIIDRTKNPDAPTPEGYVRVTFTNGDGVNDIANNKVYDVKEGTALTADKYPEVKAKDGYENPTWSTPAGTAISKDNATITATATKVKETSAKPKINDVTANDPTITGTGVPGSNIVVTKGEDIIGETTVNDDGTWSVKVPDGTTLAKGDELVVTQTEKDKKPADATTTVGEKTPEAPAAPKVEAKDDGSVTVTPPTDEDTKTVEVTYTPEGKDTLETVVVTKGEDGTWSAPEGSGLTVDPATGIVTIPADKVKDETEVTAIAKDNAGNKSKEGIATAGKNPVVEMTEAPKINQPKSFDTTVTGTATPGATVEVTLPNGEKKTTTADQEGNWTVETPKLEKDTKITAKATEEGKKPSEETKQTVAPWSSLFTAEGGELVVSKGKDVNAHDVYKKVKLIFKENNGEFVVGEDNRILLPIGNDSHAWLYVDPAKLPTKDSKVGQYTQNVTITYPDGSKQIVQVVVKVVDKTDAQKNPAVAPEKTEVKDKTALTPEEKAEVEKKVKDKNPKAEKVEVGNDGSVTLTYPDKSTNTLTPEQTVTEKAKTDAEKNPVVAPEKTEVKDKTALTDAEKKEVEGKVKTANPKATKVE